MEKDDVVNIYEDPLSMKKLEGQATLKEKVMNLTDGVELWWVSFEEEYGVALRKIKT